MLMHKLGKFGRLTIGAAAAAVLVGVSAGPATASPVTSRAPERPQTTLNSPIASGYAAVPKKGGATAFSHIQDTFTVPAVNCASTPNATAQMRAGLGGIPGGPTERVGISETCKNGEAPAYTTWYQMVPAPAVNEFTPKPGDTLNSSVTFAAGLYTLSMQDLTSGQSFSVSKPCVKICKNSSAQVTAGSPRGSVPANFTAVNFHVIIATDSAGVSGGLADANWNTTMLAQTGSPHTVAGPLLTSAPPPQSAFHDTWTP
jgi:hypothetical protein